MAVATASAYASEIEVIHQNADTSSYKQGHDVKGALYGLWTHNGNVLIQLANPAGGPQASVWKSFCTEHRLERVGTWGTHEPKSADRPHTLDVSLGFVYILCSVDGGKFVCYSVPSTGARTPPQVTDLTVLSTASPYRAFRDPEGTRKLLDSGRHMQMQTHSPGLAGHWSEQQVYFEFLKDLGNCFRQQGVEVKQFQQPGSDYIAFQIKSHELNCAIGFPPDFPQKRQVQVYCGKSSPDVIDLPTTATRAFDTILNCLTGGEGHSKPGKEGTGDKKCSRTDDKNEAREGKKGKSTKTGTKKKKKKN